MISELTYEVLRKEKTELEGKEVDIFVVKHNMSGMESILWIAENGIVLREESSQGFKSVYQSKTVAADFYKEKPFLSAVLLL